MEAINLIPKLATDLRLAILLELDRGWVRIDAIPRSKLVFGIKLMDLLYKFSYQCWTNCIEMMKPNNFVPCKSQDRSEGVLVRDVFFAKYYRNLGVQAEISMYNAT